jgi:OPA family glycerol-3-phosphate transporter-like MFS transporter
VTEAAMDRAFRRRRAQNWVLLGLLYALFYMSRYNYSATAPQLAAALGWNNTRLGVFETVMPFVYGLSVFFNGPVADRIGGKRAFLIGTIGVAAMNIGFGAILRVAELRGGAPPSTVWLLIAVWGVNGFFQSFGALSIVKVNAHWFHVSERGTFSGIFGVLIRLGLILAFTGSPNIVHWLGIAWAFWVPAIALLVFFVLNLLFMENTPADAGLGDFDTGDEDGDDSKPAPLGEVLRRIFTSRAAWTVAGASVMIGFVRRSTIDAWYPKYFSDVYKIAPKALGGFLPYEVAAWGIAIAGILGGFAFGIASDRRFQSRRGPVITMGFCGMAALLVVLGVVHRLALGAYATASLLVALSFFVNGAHGMIGGAASMDFGGKKAAATAAGLFDGLQYLMTSFPTGIGMGKLLDSAGWGAWNFAFAPFAVIGAALGASLWNTKPGRGGHGAAPPVPSNAPSRAVSHGG